MRIYKRVDVISGIVGVKYRRRGWVELSNVYHLPGKALGRITRSRRYFEGWWDSEPLARVRERFFWDAVQRLDAMLPSPDRLRLTREHDRQRGWLAAMGGERSWTWRRVPSWFSS